MCPVRYRIECWWQNPTRIKKCCKCCLVYEP
nr:MAG TPA: hypothetical protein [Bacteriophage sp.]